MRDHVVIFPDTNTLLHYPPLKDVNWQHVADARVVTLVLCMQVIHELDEKKSDARLASRAERAIKEIKGILAEGGTVRLNATLEVFNHELRSSDFPVSLSPDSKDDRIVHLVKKYLEATPQFPVFVYTEDLGMVLRCEANGIAVIEPDKGFRLESPQTEQDRKYKAAITELNNLKSLMPELEIRVLPCADEVTQPKKGMIVRVYRQPQPEDVHAAVAAAKKKYQLPPQPHPNDAISEMVGSLHGISTEDRQRYGEELEKYLLKYEKWVERMNEFKLSLGPLFRFRIDVQNNGRSPADDVEARIVLPPRLRFVAAEDEKIGQMMESAPDEPTPPKKPQTLEERLGHTFRNPLDYNPMLGNFKMPNLKLRSEPSLHFAGDASTGFVIELSIPRLLHHKSQMFGDFFSMFRTMADVGPFEAQLAITASNLPNKIERTVPFVLESDPDGE